MFVYTLTEPIDPFDELIPLPQWIADDPAPRTRWALQAILSLSDAAAELPLSADEVEHRAHAPARQIGAWTHPTSADIEAAV